MTLSKSFFLIILLLISTTIFSQSPEDSTVVTINTKSGGTIVGELVFESADSVKIITDDSRIISIARKEILSDIPILIVTKDGNQYNGVVVSDDDKSIVLKTIYLDEITIPKKDIKYKGSKDKYSEIRKNAISFNILGATPIVGITYERLITEYIGIEVGFGFISYGGGFKIYPFKAKNQRCLFYSGVTMFYFNWGGESYDGGEIYAGQGSYTNLVYIPVGLGYFGKKGFNFCIDFGPAYYKEDTKNEGSSVFGNIKFGYRF